MRGNAREEEEEEEEEEQQSDRRAAVEAEPREQERCEREAPAAVSWLCV